MLRIIFFGMEIGILEELWRLPVQIAGVYLPPAPYRFYWSMIPVVRVFPKLQRNLMGKKAPFLMVKELLDRNRITPLTGPGVNDSGFLKKVEALKPDLGVVANFDQILGERLLAIPGQGFINFHPSLLPRYRGPDPVKHILLNGEKRSGVTWHRVTKKLDGGGILAQEEFPVQPGDTEKDLLERSLVFGIRLLGHLLKRIEDGTVQEIQQNEDEATYYPAAGDEDRIKLKLMGKIV